MNQLAARGRKLLGSPMEKEARREGSNLVVTSLRPYYSKVRFLATRTGASPAFVYTIAAGATALAFGYGIGQDMSPGGRAGTIATAADTNLEQARRTNSGEEIEIDGIGIQILATSEPLLVQASEDSLLVRLELGVGGTSIPIGTPTMWPSGLGLYGNATSAISTQQLSGGRPINGNFSNGVPGFMNIRPVPEKLLWRQQSKTDSSLAIRFTAERAIVVNTTQPDEVAAAGVRGYTMPTNVWIDFMVHLLGEVRSRESYNFRG